MTQFVPEMWARSAMESITAGLHVEAGRTPPSTVNYLDQQRERHERSLRRYAAAVASAEGPLAAVLKHHQPDEDRWGARCDGCDPGDYAAGPAEWPCSTVELILGGE